MAKSKIRQWLDKYAKRADDTLRFAIQKKPEKIAKEIEMKYNNFECWDQIDDQHKREIIYGIIRELRELGDNGPY